MTGIEIIVIEIIMVMILIKHHLNKFSHTETDKEKDTTMTAQTMACILYSTLSVEE